MTFPSMQRHGISVSKEAQSLITKLLIKDKSTRLGADGDWQAIMAHPFFESID